MSSSALALNKEVLSEKKGRIRIYWQWQQRRYLELSRSHSMAIWISPIWVTCQKAEKPSKPGWFLKKKESQDMNGSKNLFKKMVISHLSSVHLLKNRRVCRPSKLQQLSMKDWARKFIRNFDLQCFMAN